MPAKEHNFVKNHQSFSLIALGYQTESLCSCQNIWNLLRIEPIPMWKCTFRHNKHRLRSTCTSRQSDQDKYCSLEAGRKRTMSHFEGRGSFQMFFPLVVLRFEQCHNKTNTGFLQPAWIQISLRIRAIWTAYLLYAGSFCNTQRIW